MSDDDDDGVVLVTEPTGNVVPIKRVDLVGEGMSGSIPVLSDREMAARHEALLRRKAEELAKLMNEALADQFITAVNVQLSPFGKYVVQGVHIGRNYF